MSDLAQLSADQRALLELLLREEGKNPDQLLPIPRRPDGDTAPLSAAQERMWFAHQLAPQGSAYNIQTALRIAGTLDVARLQRALDRLAERHETTRTSFEKDGDRVIQRIHPPRPVPLARVSIPSQSEVAAFVDREAQRPWNLAAAPSLRVTLIAIGEREHVLLLGMHHILSDGWSVGVLVRDLWRLYDAPDSLPALAVQYGDYAAWERGQDAATGDGHLAFWREQLRDAVDYVELPLDHPRRPGTAGRGALRTLALPSELVRAIRQCARDLNASPFAVCLAGFNLLLSELTGDTDLLVGTPVANRERSDLEGLIGYFANTLVLRSEWYRETSFGELVEQTRDGSLAALGHQNFPFEKVVEEMNPRRVPGANPLFQVFFAFQKYALDTLRAEGLEISEFDYASRVTRFDLELHVWETATGGIDAVFVHAADLFDAATIARWADRWMQILSRACADPATHAAALIERHPPRAASSSDAIEQARIELEAAARLDSVTRAVALVHEAAAPEIARIPLAELLPPNAASPIPRAIAQPQPEATSVLPPDNRRPAISHGAPFELDPAGPTTLAALLARAAADHPAAGCRFLPANDFVPYPRLLEDARRAQAWLQSLGVAPATVLLLQLTDERDILTCFWGAVLAGAVPFILPVPDGFHPEAATRLTATWMHLDSPTIVAHRDSAPEWTREKRVLPWHRADWERCAPAAAPHPSRPDDIAFFAQSSGTTGQPKCIPLRHRNVVSRVLASIAFTGLDATRVFLNWLPLDHIGSISDWHVRCVAAGGNPIYANKQPILADPLVWLDWIERYGVTDTWAPNFAYNLLIEALEQRGRRWNLRRLRTCLTAAEGIACTTLDRLEDLLAASGFSRGVFQPAFGMAEVASGITYHLAEPGARVPRRAARGDSRLIVDCGAPIHGVSLRIVDDAGQVVPEAQAGHFQIRGAPLFPGYHGLPQQNAERFTADGWFDTGDFAFLVDGHLFITGREAGEIVVNGRKCACEDIERAAASVPGVRAESAVICAVRENDEPRFVLFFSPQAGEQPSDVARRLRGTITAQFGLRVDHVVSVEPQEIVRTSIGKLQRAVLARQFEAGRFQGRVQSLQPETSIPACFFRTEWNRSPRPSVLRTSQTIHLIADAGSLAPAFSQALREAGHRVETFDERAAGSAPETLHLVDLFCHRPPANDTPGIDRSLAIAEHLRTLLQALARNPPRECQLSVVTCLAQATGREDAVQCFDAVVSGLLKTAALEFHPWLRCRQIDLASPSDPHQATLLVDEILSDAAEAEVAYRGLRRFVPAIAPIDLRRAPLKADVFNPDGFYLVSGGLGGIGRLLSTRLNRDYGLRLLLVGRSPLTEERRQFLAQYPEIAYAVADVSDGEALRQVLQRHETESGRPLAGVLHLAGVGNWEHQQRTIEQHRLTGITADEFREQFRAKVDGTHRLYELVRARPGAMFIAASSVLGVFGGASFGAYAAANSFLQTFCRARAQADGVSVHCFHWSPWKNSGMSRGQDPAFAAAQGYLSLSPDEGWYAFLVALTHGQHDLIIGLDPAHARSGYARRQITLFYTAKETDAAERDLSAAIEPVAHRLGRSCSVQLQRVDAIPNDLSRLLAAMPDEPAPPPATREMELKLLEIFQGALAQSAMRPDDNFFELGAHSLLLARLEAEIQSRVSPKVALLDLFRFPTARSLARFIVSSEAPKISPTAPRADRDSGRQAMREARQRHRAGRI